MEGVMTACPHILSARCHLHAALLQLVQARRALQDSGRDASRLVEIEADIRLVQEWLVGEQAMVAKEAV
jgi:hypothetical protein